jgi:hypothetical protein
MAWRPTPREGTAIELPLATVLLSPEQLVHDGLS